MAVEHPSSIATMGSLKDLIGEDLGNYHILEEVGRGGMATVFRAVDLDSDQEVAIKILSPYVAQEPKFKARFEQEINVLLNLQHPNIVPVLDYGEIDEYSYIVMPFLTSGTLSQRLTQGPLPLKAAAEVINQMSQALDYAHARGVVHRDLKPSNIMISDDGQALLTDFGFARVADNSLSLTGSALIGTPAYMSPEQCRGDDATPLSDQYALGVILYQMTTGTLPYEAETPMGVVIMHATEPIPPPRNVDPDLPEEVEKVILKALEKKPEDRYPSLIAFNEAVQFAIFGRRTSYQSGLSDDELFGHSTEVMEGLSTKLSMFYMRSRNLVRSQPSTVFLVAIAFMSFLWGIFGFSGNGGEAGNNTPFPVVITGTDRSAELEATINALYTANVPEAGTVLAPGAFETAVEATLEAILASAFTQTQASIPSATETTEITVTPTPSSTLFLYFSPTPSRSTPRPTTIPGPTSTFTPKPPTFTPKPTNTKENCAALPTSNPHYCPPSATP
jgi:serine/threonine protein kinase